MMQYSSPDSLQPPEGHLDDESQDTPGLTGWRFLDKVPRGSMDKKAALDLLNPAVGPAGALGVTGPVGPGYFRDEIWRGIALRAYLAVARDQLPPSVVAIKENTTVDIIRQRVKKVRRFILWVTGVRDDWRRPALGTKVTPEVQALIIRDPRPYSRIAKSYGLSVRHVTRIKQEALDREQKKREFQALQAPDEGGNFEHHPSGKAKREKLQADQTGKGRASGGKAAPAQGRVKHRDELPR